MAKARACDVCSLRKIRCNGDNPCLPCVKAGFDCSFAKKPQKPGPKGPRLATSKRIRRELDDIRAHGGPQPSVKPGFQAQLPRSEPPLPDFSNGFDGHTTTSTTSAITFNDVCAYLEMFHFKMYPIWPVIDRTHLLEQLGEDMRDPEQAALAFAVCAATGAQLRLCSEPNPSVGFEQNSLCDRFATEAEKRRLTYDYREGGTIAGVLIPFFLHAYYTKKKRRYSATMYIREAVTLAQLLGLDRESSYDSLPPQEAHFRRKLFYLLFVTERGHVMQYDINAILRPSIAQPEAQDDPDPHLITAFLSLVRLFVAVDGMLAGEGVDDPGRVFAVESLEALQRQLREQPDFAPFSNEIQKTDVFVTQQWMRMLLWQLSMKKVSLTASSPDDPLSLTYPAHIARDALAFLSNTSLDSMIAHGPGMELKIFEIANTLLDVINIVPSLSTQSNTFLEQAPRDVFHSLSCLLASLSGGRSYSLNLLQSKISESTVSFSSIPRLIELHDNEHGSSPSSASYPSVNANAEQSTSPTSIEFGNRTGGWVQDQDQTHDGTLQGPSHQPQTIGHILLQRHNTTDSNGTTGSWTTSYSPTFADILVEEPIIAPPRNVISPQNWSGTMT